MHSQVVMANVVAGVEVFQVHHPRNGGQPPEVM
jgi:hypothetical protein